MAIREVAKVALVWVDHLGEVNRIDGHLELELFGES